MELNRKYRCDTPLAQQPFSCVQFIHFRYGAFFCNLGFCIVRDCIWPVCINAPPAIAIATAATTDLERQGNIVLFLRLSHVAILFARCEWLDGQWGTRGNRSGSGNSKVCQKSSKKSNGFCNSNSSVRLANPPRCSLCARLNLHCARSSVAAKRSGLQRQQEEDLRRKMPTKSSVKPSSAAKPSRPKTAPAANYNNWPIR